MLSPSAPGPLCYRRSTPRRSRTALVRPGPGDDGAGGDEAGGEGEGRGGRPLENASTDRGAGEHGRDGADSPVRLGTGAAGESAVGGEAGQRQCQDGGGQVGRAEMAHGRVLQAEG